MSPAERAFPGFVAGLARGLYKAVLTDPDVFLLAVTASCLGGRSRRVRGIGTGLAMYVFFRRLDRYVDAGIQLSRRARVIRQAATEGQNHGPITHT